MDIYVQFLWVYTRIYNCGQLHCDFRRDSAQSGQNLPCWAHTTLSRSCNYYMHTCIVCSTSMYMYIHVHVRAIWDERKIYYCMPSRF